MEDFIKLKDRCKEQARTGVRGSVNQAFQICSSASRPKFIKPSGHVPIDHYFKHIELKAKVTTLEAEIVRLSSLKAENEQAVD